MVTDGQPVGSTQVAFGRGDTVLATAWADENGHFAMEPRALGPHSWWVDVKPEWNRMLLPRRYAPRVAWLGGDVFVEDLPLRTCARLRVDLASHPLTTGAAAVLPLVFGRDPAQPFAARFADHIIEAKIGAGRVSLLLVVVHDGHARGYLLHHDVPESALGNEYEIQLPTVVDSSASASHLGPGFFQVLDLHAGAGGPTPHLEPLVRAWAIARLGATVDFSSEVHREELLRLIESALRRALAGVAPVAEIEAALARLPDCTADAWAHDALSGPLGAALAPGPTAAGTGHRRPSSPPRASREQAPPHDESRPAETEDQPQPWQPTPSRAGVTTRTR